MFFIEETIINCMSIFKYCYNVCFIIFFAVVMSRCSVTYGMTQKRGFKYLGELFLVYIIESVYVELAEIIYAIAPEADSLLGMGTDIYLSGIITAAECFIFMRFIDELLGRTGMTRALGVFAAAVIMTAAGYNVNGALGSVLLLDLYSIPLIAAAAYFRHELKKCDDERRITALKFRSVISASVIFAVLIIIENVICVAVYGSEISRVSLFFERRISYADDAFSVVLGLLVMRIADRCADEHMSEVIEAAVGSYAASAGRQHVTITNAAEHNDNYGGAVGEAGMKPSVMRLRSDSEQLASFCRSYRITDRESEILKLLVEGRTNQEIADSLLISVGTVKAHVHSIYRKLEVTRRSQLMNVFSSYDGGEN